LTAVTSAAATRGGAGALPRVTLHAPDGAAAEVYLHGAHVTSWRPAPGQEERLFLSTRSEFRHGAAIRGGIPVIFPQFAAEGPLPRHGFARTSEWRLDGMRSEGGECIATLSLSDSPATQAVWAAAFRARLTVRVGGSHLDVALDVENRGSSSFAFTCALHSYLRVHDVGEVEVLGLRGVRYRESADPTTLRVDASPTVRVSGELDRVYVDAPRALLLREADRTLGIEMRGFRDIVLWNPGRERALTLPDMDPDGERVMLCVEAAAVQTPITLGVGENWHGAQTLDAVVRMPADTGAIDERK
jgi:glucose-6-phosphate 1-epimerase